MCYAHTFVVPTIQYYVSTHCTVYHTVCLQHDDQLVQRCGTLWLSIAWYAVLNSFTGWATVVYSG